MLTREIRLQKKNKKTYTLKKLSAEAKTQEIRDASFIAPKIFSLCSPYFFFFHCIVAKPVPRADTKQPGRRGYQNQKYSRQTVITGTTNHSTVPKSSSARRTRREVTVTNLLLVPSLLAPPSHVVRQRTIASQVTVKDVRYKCPLSVGAKTTPCRQRR